MLPEKIYVLKAANNFFAKIKSVSLLMFKNSNCDSESIDITLLFRWLMTWRGPRKPRLTPSYISFLAVTDHSENSG